jgi:hypothetical protein
MDEQEIQRRNAVVYRKLFEVGIIGMTVILALLLEVLSMAFGKLIQSQFSFDGHFYLTLSIFFTQLTIVIMLVGIIYTLIFSHDFYEIPFKPIFFVVTILFIILPMNVSSVLMRTALHESNIYTSNSELAKYYEIGMIILMIPFFSLIIYSNLVSKLDSTGRISEGQSATAIVFNFGGFLFCLGSILCIMFNHYNFLVILSLLTVIGGLLYLVFALLFRLELRVNWKDRDKIV